ncbi:MAG: LD-carboxypeptidase [Clostridia bacterium]|nr:LD-carboxypeptidase [Clostridia bacterium]
MIAPRLCPGDEIRIIAPSQSLSIVREDIYHEALAFLQNQGYHVTFGAHSRERDDFDSSSVQARVNDLHEAFGHVFPMMTFPVGGRVRIRAEGEKRLVTIVDHKIYNCQGKIRRPSCVV